MNPISIQYHVNLILPHMLRRLCLYIPIIMNIEGYLIISNILGKILLTHTSIYPLEAYHEATPNKQAKGKIPARSWSIKSPSGTHSGRTISGKRILRPARPAPGPLRDDTTSSNRQGYCHRDLKAVRRQPCDLLSSSWNVRPSGPHRSGPTKTGTEEPAQVYARDYRIHQAATFTATRCNPGRPYSRSIRKVRCLPPSSDHRERTCQYQKKESDREKHASISFFKDGTTLIDQYEQLRTSTISPDGELHTPGYGVFVLRGMLGWIKALPTLAPKPEKEPEYTRIGSTVKVSKIQPENYSSVVNVLANMVICCLGGSS
jgi:hypothetical protein